MPTLDELFLDFDTGDISWDVRVNGASIPDVLNIEWSFNIAGVPTATFEIRGPAPVIIAFDAEISIDAGYNGQMARVFTGDVQHIQPNEEGRSVESQGKTWALDVPFHKVIQTFNHVAQDTALTNLVVLSGITDYSVTVPTPIWQIGTVVQQTLEFQTYGDAINKVGEPNGVRWYETATGTLIVAPLDPIPSATPWRTYFSMQTLGGLQEAYPLPEITSGRPHIVSCSGTQDIREVKNRAYVRGATFTQINPDGSTDSIDIEVFAQAPSPWVVNPDGTQAYNDELFANELIDTVVFAAAVAARLVALKNRLFTRVTLTLDKMDPQISVGRTIRIVDPNYSGIVGNFFVEGFTTRIGGDGECVTTIDAVGGDSAGQSVNVNPVALFTHKVVRQVMGNKVWASITVDARGSLDFDGTIVSYSWTDNQAVHVASGIGSVRTFTYDPAALSPTPLTITLTVTDNLGLTGSITLTIDLGSTGPTVAIPALFTAFDTWFSASQDGGIHWNDQATTHAISVDCKPDDGGHDGWAVYGTQAGELYKTEDYCATAPVLKMNAVGSPMVHVWWDKQHNNDVWAVTQDGRLYRSQNNGDSWVLYENLRTKLNKPNLRANRIGTPPPDGVWIFGGDGTKPLITFDPVRAHAWGFAAIGGELATDLGTGGFTSKFQYEVYQIHNDRDLYGFNPVTATWTRVKQNVVANGTLGHLRTDRNTGFMYALWAPNTLPDYSFPGKSMIRSTDGGITWTSIWDVVVNPCSIVTGYGVRDYEIDAAGDLYIVVSFGDGIASNTNDCAPMKVYKSTTQGATWQLLFTAAAFDSNSPVTVNSAPNATSITVSANGQHIYVQSRNNGASNFWWVHKHPVSFYSNDFGNSWATRQNADVTGLTASQNVTLNDTATFVNNDRLAYFAWVGTGTAPKVYTSDDFGLTWTLRSSPAYLSIVGTPKWRASWGNTWGFWCQQTGVQRPAHLFITTDNGNTIAETTFPLVPSTNGGQPADSFTFDPLLDVSYFADETPATATHNSELRILHPFNPATHTAAVIKSGFVGSPTMSGDSWFRTDIPEAVGPSSDVYIVDAATRIGSPSFAIILDSATMPAGPYCTDDIFGDGSHWKRPIGAPAGKTHGRWISPNLEGGKFSFGYDDNNLWNGDVGASGAVQCAQAAFQMDAGDAANHGLWEGELLGNVADTYLVSAEGTADGTLYKTFDRWATGGKVRPAAGFPAAPAGANAKMTAISGASKPAPTVGQILVGRSIQTTATGTSYPRQVAQLGLLTWTLISNPAPAAQIAVGFMKRINGNLYRVFAKQRTEGMMHPGQLQRSPDGITWTNVGPAPQTSGAESWGINNICEGSNGYLYAVACSDFGAGAGATANFYSRIYRSIDDGANWVEIFAESVADTGVWRRIIDITGHPANQDTIVALGDRTGGLLQLWYSLDVSQASPTFTRVSTVHTTSTAGNRNCEMLDNGRVVAQHGDTAHIAYLDPPYTGAWVTPAVDPGEGQYGRSLIRAPANGAIAKPGCMFYATGPGSVSWKIKRTLDYGLTWVEIFRLTNYPTSTTDIAGIFYKVEEDALYIATSDTDSSGRVWVLPQATQITPGTATDLTFDLDTQFSGASDTIGFNAITETPTILVQQPPPQGTPAPPPPPPPDTSPPPPPPGQGQTGSRDKLKQPFASSSIWNMPIGSGAQLVPANIPVASNFRADEDIIVMKPTSPARQVWTNNVGWGYCGGGGTRCTETNYSGFDVPIPDSFVLPDECPDTPNSCGAFLLADGRTLRQFQPVTRCGAAGHVTAYDISPPLQDIYGDGLYGAHGGSGLSSLGGTIRLNELIVGGVIRHALKLNVWAEIALSGTNGGFRWPATKADGCAPGCYGGQNPALRAGSLCCLRSDFVVASLETAPAKIIAQALMDYGCYIVDSTSFDAYAFATERGPDGRVTTNFNTTWGFAWNVSGNSGSAWGRDIVKMISALYVVNNNSVSAVGGGGTPRVALAPPLA